MKLVASLGRPLDVRHMRLVSVACVAALLFWACPSAQAADQALVDKGKRFLDARGSFILGYLHFGSTYTGHSCIGVHDVADAGGRLLPGQFCLRYRFDWKNGFGDGWTTVDFLFDGAGRFYALNNCRSNAGLLNRPFSTANLSIQLLGNVLYEVFRNDLNEEDRRILRNLIDSADAQALLQWSLRFHQQLLRP